MNFEKYRAKNLLNIELKIKQAIGLCFLVSISCIVLLDFEEILRLDFYKSQWDAITRVISGVFYLDKDKEITVMKIFNLQWLLASVDWLPLQRILIRIFNLLIPNLRALIYAHLCLMVFSLIIPFFVFKPNENIKISYVFQVSLFISAFFQNKLIREIAYTTHSESLFFFLIALSVFFFRNAIRGNRENMSYSCLYFIIFCLTLLRYEAWLIMFVLFAILVFHFIQANKYKHILSSFLLSIGPIVWLLLTYIKTGIWFVFLQAPKKDAQFNYTSLQIERINSNLMEFIGFMAIPLFICLYLINKKTIEKKVFVYIFLSALISSGYVLFSINKNTLAADLRYISPFVFFVFSFVGLSISSISKYNYKKIALMLIAVFVLSLQGRFMWKGDISESYVDYNFIGLKDGVSYIKELDKKLDYKNSEYFYIFSECCYAELIMLKANLLDRRQVKSIRPIRKEENPRKKYSPLFKYRVFDKNIPKHIVIIKRRTSWTHFETIFKKIFKKYYHLEYENEGIKILSKNHLIWQSADLDLLTFEKTF